jgi:predicted RNA methylase
MFNKDFYPTPTDVIDIMLDGYSLEGKVILEPSAGKGNIVDYCIGSGAATVIACEINQDLKKILATKCKIIADDFLTVKQEDISHINMIIMNPPFSADERHIIHAFEIAPEGCDIIALCNTNTIKNPHTKAREKLHSILFNYGSSKDLKNCFTDSERTTNVDVSLVKIKKPGTSYKSEFEGFFLEEDPEEQQFNGIMPYNFIRDLVNRYVSAVKIYDKQLESAVELKNTLGSFYGGSIGFQVTEDGKPKCRNDFKKDLQKAGWQFIFNKMNMDKYATKGLKSDINKFVEQQTEVPFTMRNIYKMLEIVIATQSQRMDKAMLEVFEKLTMHYDENRYNVEGWKTNSHYLINEKFIMPYLVTPGYSGIDTRHYGGNSVELIEDFVKALCYLTGKNFDDCLSFYQRIRADWHINFNGKRLTREMVGNLESWETNVWQKKASVSFGFEHQAKEYIEELQAKGFKNLEVIAPVEWGQWADWDFFTIRCYKKGTVHFKFKDNRLWGTFNQHIARIKGYPLFEPKKKAA